MDDYHDWEIVSVALTKVGSEDWSLALEVTDGQHAHRIVFDRADWIGADIAAVVADESGIGDIRESDDGIAERHRVNKHCKRGYLIQLNSGSSFRVFSAPPVIQVRDHSPLDGEQ